MNEIYIARDKEKIGPFDPDTIRRHVVQGEILPDEWAWVEGQEGWKPLRELVALDEPPASRTSLSEDSRGSRKVTSRIKIVTFSFITVVVVGMIAAGVFWKMRNSDPAYATFRAWGELQAIDAAEISDFPMIDDVIEEMADLSKRYRNAAERYARIPLENADPLLVDHVRESIPVFTEGSNLFREYGVYLTQIRADLETSRDRAANVAVGLGASSPATGAAIDQVTENIVQTKYEDSEVFKELDRRESEFYEKLKRLDERDKELARVLSEKFGRVFIDL